MVEEGFGILQTRPAAPSQVPRPRRMDEDFEAWPPDARYAYWRVQFAQRLPELGDAEAGTALYAAAIGADGGQYPRQKQGVRGLILSGVFE